MGGVIQTVGGCLGLSSLFMVAGCAEPPATGAAEARAILDDVR